MIQPISPINEDQPPATLGMEGIKRYWDKEHERWAAKIGPGELYVSAYNELIVTVLGSCVSACIRDTVSGIGGMNHFMLPEAAQYNSPRFDSLKTRYGTWAMEVLINEILKNGGERKNLEVKIFGGGAVVKSISNDVGKKNIEFAKQYLSDEKLTIHASDLGGELPRKLHFSPDTGRCRVRLIKSAGTVLKAREEAYAERVSKGTDGSIELF